MALTMQSATYGRGAEEVKRLKNKVTEELAFMFNRITTENAKIFTTLDKYWSGADAKRFAAVLTEKTNNAAKKVKTSITQLEAAIDADYKNFINMQNSNKNIIK